MSVTPSHDLSEQNGILDRLDCAPAWAFVGILYVARWVVLAPLLLMEILLWDQSGSLSVRGSAISLFIGIVLVGPLIETLVECTAPYVAMDRLHKIGLGRPWNFILFSAAIMALLHPMVGAIIPSLVTGAALAYCYARFAASGHMRAIGATFLFHALINIVGWLIIVLHRIPGGE